MLNEKMKFMRFLDYGRWSGEEILNYEWLNLANRNASGDQILLTHYLGYITDRQTSFEIIFERLDYIFSQMVCDYMDCTKSVDELLDPNGFSVEFVNSCKTLVFAYNSFISDSTSTVTLDINF